MITIINESRTLGKKYHADVNVTFVGRRCNLNQNWNNDKCWCKCKNMGKHQVCEKKIIWNLGTCTCKKEVLLVFSRYLWWIYKGDKSCSKNFFNKNYSNKNYSNRNYFSKFYGRIFAWFSLITKSLLKIVSIYYCFIKHWAKEKHFFRYCNSSKKLNETDINNII